MSSVPLFIALCNAKGSTVTFHREPAGVECPCRTPEGFRDPRFHLELPKYGDQTVTFDATQAGNLDFTQPSRDYFFLAKGAAADASPLIYVGSTYANEHVANFRVVISGIEFPVRGNVTAYDVYRSTNNGPQQYIGTINVGTTTFTDNNLPNGATLPNDYPVLCNEEGLIAVPVEFNVKGFVQPIQSTRATRLNAEILTEMFGEVQADDHLGILPCTWLGNPLDFREWSQSGDEYVVYDGRRFMVVNSNKIPDPDDGNPNHHWEVGLRLITSVPIS